MDKDILQQYKNKTILITGGTGYLGFSIAKALSSVRCTILLLSRKSQLPAQLPKTAAIIKVVTADVQTIGWDTYLKGVDIIFHLAAQTSSKYANDNPLEDLQINVLPVVRLIESLQKSNLRPDIIFAGTSTQVGLTKDVPIDESLRDNPVTVYDINKLTEEKYLLYYSNQLGGRAVSLRLTNVYGPGPTSSKSDRGILNLMVKKALHKEALTLYGDGNFIRDYVFVEDVVSAFLNAGAKIGKVKGTYYLIGSGVGYTIKQMVEMIQKKVQAKNGYTSPITSVPMPENISPIELRNFVADITKFKKLSNWTPATTLSEGVDKTIAHFFNVKQ